MQVRAFMHRCISPGGLRRTPFYTQALRAILGYIDMMAGRQGVPVFWPLLEFLEGNHPYLKYPSSINKRLSYVSSRRPPFILMAPGVIAQRGATLL